MENKNNLKDKVLDFIKKHKFISTLVLISVISIIYIIASAGDNQKESITKRPSPSPSTKPLSLGNSREYKREDPGRVYLINRFDTVPGIIKTAWYENKVMYATQRGVFSLWQNQQILKTQIDDADFSGNGRVVYIQENNLFVANTYLGTIEPLDTSSSKAKVNDSGEYAAYYKNGLLTIVNLVTKETKSSNIKNNNFDWIPKSQYLYVYDDKVSSVDVFDINFQKISGRKIESSELFWGINSNQQYIATTFGETLRITDVSSNKTFDYNFTESSEIVASWISDKQVFVTEKIKRGIYDLYDQFFWYIDVDNNSKTYLTNSMVVPNKINTNIEPKINNDKTAILLTDNDGKIWIISLVPSYISVYKEAGLSFYKVEVNTQEY